MKQILCSAALAVTAVGCTPQAALETADMVLTNGKVVTVDDAHPEAEAIAIKDGLILAVGSSDDIASHVGNDTEVIDLEGRLAVPGFIEGHGHFESLGNFKMILDLTKVNNWNEIITMVGDAAQDAEPGEWIQGRGWHQEKWDEVPPGAVEGMSDHAGLSEVSPNNPVYLERASAHGAFANAAAMKLAGIHRDTSDPPGGTIVKGADGEPTGALREDAEDLVEDALDAYLDSRSAEIRRADAERRVELASRDLLSKGITSFQDAGTSFETIDFYKEMAEAGRLPVRLYIMVRYETNEAMDQRLPDYRMTNGYDGHVTIRSIKRQIDGALGSHGAWLLEPYEDLDTVALSSKRSRKSPVPPSSRCDTASKSTRTPLAIARIAKCSTSTRKRLQTLKTGAPISAGASSTHNTCIPMICHASPSSG